MYKILHLGKEIAEFEELIDAHRYVVDMHIPLQVVDSQGFAVTLIGRPPSVVAQRILEIMTAQGCNRGQAYTIYRREKKTGKPEQYRPPGRPARPDSKLKARIDELVSKGSSPTAAYQKARREAALAKTGLEPRPVGRPSAIELAIRRMVTDLADLGVTEAEARSAYTECWAIRGPIAQTMPEDVQIISNRKVATAKLRRARAAAPAVEVTQ